jgi:hypothetical protein
VKFFSVHDANVTGLLDYDHLLALGNRKWKLDRIALPRESEQVLTGQLK